MRQIGIVFVIAVLVAVSAYADEAKRQCYGSIEDYGQTNNLSTPGQQPLLTDDKCEAATEQELRVPLLEIPQDDEDPMSLTLGGKNLGGALRFKIPFSY